MFGSSNSGHCWGIRNGELQTPAKHEQGPANGSNVTIFLQVKSPLNPQVHGLQLFNHRFYNVFRNISRIPSQKSMKRIQYQDVCELVDIVADENYLVY